MVLAFERLTEENASQRAADLMRTVRAQVGYTPNAHRIFANSTAFYEVYRASLDTFLNATSLSETERNIVLLSASLYHECGYCVAAHSSFARRTGVESEIIEDLRLGNPLSNPRLQALRATVESLLRADGRLSLAEKQSFFDAGYTPQNLLDVILGVSIKTMSNYANIIAQTPLDEVYTPFLWPDKQMSGGDASTAVSAP